jgi:outer membrane immunogenic protein
VIGLEADASGLFSDNGVSHTFDYFHSADFFCDGDLHCLENYDGTGKVNGGDLDWIATFRARLGFLAGDEGRLMIYGTGGLALAGVQGLSGSFDDTDGVGWCEVNDSDQPCGFFGDSDDHIQVGFAAGAGFEWAWTDNVSFGLEYLFLGFDDDNGDKLTFYGDDGRSFAFEDELDHLHVVRAKLNWHFPTP